MELDFTNNPAAPASPTPANRGAVNQAPINQPPGQNPPLASEPVTALSSVQPSISQPPPVVQPPSPPPPPTPPTTDYSQPIESAGPNKALILVIIIGLVLVIGGVVGYLVYRNKKSTLVSIDNNLVSSPVDPQVANRDAQRQSDLAKIKNYINLYYSDKNAYPVSKQFQKFDDLLGSVYTSLVPQYASPGNMPIDPLYPDYWYGYRSIDGQSYELTARLENETDLQGSYDLTGNFLYTLTPSTASGTTNSSSSSSSSTDSSFPTNNSGSLLDQ